MTKREQVTFNRSLNLQLTEVFMVFQIKKVKTKFFESDDSPLINGIFQNNKQILNF